MSMFKRATRKRVWLKIGIMGPSGSGKSHSSLLLAEGLAAGGEIAAIDTENGSLSLYDDVTGFDVVDLAPPFTTQKYIDAIKAAEAAGYKVLVIDSFSHAWKYLLTLKEDYDARGIGGDNRYRNQQTNWKFVKPLADELKAAILQCQMHVVCCMRAKTEYAQEGGRVTKLGMAAVQEPDVEYEFTTVFDIAMGNRVMASKDRTKMFRGSSFVIDASTGKQFLDWLDSASSQETTTPNGQESAQAESVRTEEPEPTRAAPPVVSEGGQFLKSLKLSADQLNSWKDDAKTLGHKFQDLALVAKLAGVKNADELRDYASTLQFERDLGDRPEDVADLFALIREAKCEWWRVLVSAATEGVGTWEELEPFVNGYLQRTEVAA